MIEEKKKRYLSGERAISDGKHKTLIDVLLEKHLETKEFSEEDVREEINNFIVAGHETVGISTMWAIYLIGQYPEVQAKLHEEIDLVFGEDRERPVTEKDLKDLQYMDCVLKECNRIYPTVPILGRNAKEEIKICGSTIPKDTTCAIVTYFLHRDEDVFPDPEKFDPDRFSPENRVNIPEFAYIPFSGGPRNCIGYKFAEMEIGTIMCYILRNFTVESLNKVLPVPCISLQASEPIRIKMRPRVVHQS
ncbi:Cytochrome P450 4V2 [Araneus ventricosus]|uniref:Cytochrome P450 4V2 n=1 Tax=Araneus ventricosus TaxID=182803 RepID=A0A4Y2EC72_ARAVE|nr:Cytochrome P450 4V2 [Araneus ventricosus]